MVTGLDFREEQIATEAAESARDVTQSSIINSQEQLANQACKHYNQITKTYDQ